MEISVDDGSGLIRQYGQNLGALEGCTNYTLSGELTVIVLEHLQGDNGGVQVKGITCGPAGVAVMFDSIDVLPAPKPAT